MKHICERVPKWRAPACSSRSFSVRESCEFLVEFSSSSPGEIPEGEIGKLATDVFSFHIWSETVDDRQCWD